MIFIKSVLTGCRICAHLLHLSVSLQMIDIFIKEQSASSPLTDQKKRQDRESNDKDNDTNESNHAGPCLLLSSLEVG